MSNNVSEQGQRLLNHMLEVGLCRDVSISRLHQVTRGFIIEDDNKRMQQYVGSIVSRVNKRQIGFKIVPGQLKRTYRVIRAA